MSEEAICICEKHDFYDFFPNNEKTKCPCCEVEHLTEQLNSKQDALSAALLALDNAVEQCVGLEAELDRYKQGVEMDGEVRCILLAKSEGTCGKAQIIIPIIPIDDSILIGNRVRLLVMKEEE